MQNVFSENCYQFVFLFSKIKLIYEISAKQDNPQDLPSGLPSFTT